MSFLTIWGRRFKSSLPDQLFSNIYGSRETVKTDPLVLPQVLYLWDPHKQ
jgi:hypothetical protein